MPSLSLVKPVGGSLDWTTAIYGLVEVGSWRFHLFVEDFTRAKEWGFREWDVFACLFFSSTIWREIFGSRLTFDDSPIHSHLV